MNKPLRKLNTQINSDCNNCSFYETCYSKNELKEAKKILGDEELDNLL